ncbi:hypothetical protein Dsin_013333 [Dipteronia sinensis]|uniref:RRM domain-containing protein n=1 Tax=Dipteronia sinensis TaxID=43782 RepID=A0AAE0AK91_9ROSI|nr:hypothetical protein Dsin_013333 [Dipteronia sinensis]
MMCLHIISGWMKLSKERVTNSLGCEGSQIVSSSRALRKDFRDGLFSIFIDNLNPKVDLKFLWGFFKVFGRVRDVFLSVTFHHRRSSFAFVKFGLWEEANKVANMVNGKQILGWPIISKMAAFGWKNRRSMALSQSGSRLVDGKGSNVNGKVNSAKKGHQMRQTFVDVINGHHDRSKEESLKMLEKVQEKIGFMNNMPLWEDHFTSMNEWSDKFIPKSRLVLIRCCGVPLPCWNSGFFMKLGWKLGEPVHVEEDTLKRRWLDKWRLLVLVPQEWQCPSKIKVLMGGKCFGFKVSEESTSVDSLWLERFLGMMPVNSRSGMMSSPVVVNSRISNGVANPLSDVEHREEVKKMMGDGDKVIQKNKMYHAFGPISNVKTMVEDNAILSRRKKTAVRRGSVVIRKWCGSRGCKMKEEDLSFLGSEYLKDQVNDLTVGLNSNSQFLRVARFISDISNKGDIGQEVVSKCFKKKSSSEEKLKDEMVVGPFSEISVGSKGCDPVCDKDVWSRPPTLFQADSNEVLEKGMGLGFTFYGRKKELLDIIAKRDVVNDNRFRDLMRRALCCCVFLFASGGFAKSCFLVMGRITAAGVLYLFFVCSVFWLALFCSSPVGLWLVLLLVDEEPGWENIASDEEDERGL